MSSDYISRQAAIDAIDETDWYHQNRNGEIVHGANSAEHQPWYKSDDVYNALGSVPSADVVEVARKPVIGYEGYYEVDQFGRVNSINRMVRVNDNGRIYDKPLIGKQMKQSLHTKGYKTVSLTKDGDTKTLYVHRIVAEAFIPNPNNFPCVNHIDEDKTNNFVENLEWCSEQYNTTYGKARIKQAKALRGRGLADCHKQKISDGVKRYYHSKGERKDG